MTQAVSAIIATVGRPELLRLCLESLAKQTVRVAEVVVVHCGSDSETLEVTNDSRWREAGFEVRYFHHPERNCARQRNFAISQAKHDYLLLIDDDVEVDPHWVEELLKPIWADSLVGATMGRLTNQPMATPTFFWRLYRRLLHGKDEGFRPGKLIGAALRTDFQRQPNNQFRASGSAVAPVRYGAMHSNRSAALHHSSRAVLQVRISILVIV